MAIEPTRILLHDNGEDVETLWGIPVESPPGRTFVRLDNVPFLHAKPTFDEVVEVAEDEAHPGFLACTAPASDWCTPFERVEAIAPSR
ncbi:MAG: hypothetical protein Q8P18_01915 [Pseudomonadota bacterium]|nr:hypothetical protein [Pseudomonadota bacterium]